MSGVAVAMLGARMHYAVPRLLPNYGLLDRFFTDTYLGNKPGLETIFRAIPDRVIPAGLHRWLGRSDPGIPPHKVISFDALGVWYALALRRARNANSQEAIYVEAAKRFNHRILREGLGTPDAIYGFNTASLELFEHAKQQNITCILEQTSLPKKIEQELWNTEFESWPELVMTTPEPLNESPIPRRESMEWSLADFIVTPSEFVAESLQSSGVPASKIRVIPYGVSPERFPVRQTSSESADKRPVRFLFLGKINLGKGIPYLIEAVKTFKQTEFELRLAGGVYLNLFPLLKSKPRIDFLGPVPRSRVVGLYHWADVLVLPSLYEGSATVTYEALMCGVPIIATPNAGSCVRNGVDGFIVEPRNPQSLASAMRCYISDRNLLSNHRKAAISGRARVSLSRYGSELSALVKRAIV